MLFYYYYCSVNTVIALYAGQGDRKLTYNAAE